MSCPQQCLKINNHGDLATNHVSTFQILIQNLKQFTRPNFYFQVKVQRMIRACKPTDTKEVRTVAN